MAPDSQPARREAPAVLAAAAAAAGFAPSIHNTQPWRWQVSAAALELFADRGRQLPNVDPEGRMLTISCGAALHHARVALAAEGWTAQVARLPVAGDPDRLARVTLDQQVPVTAAAMRAFQTLRLRHTDRRPVADTPVAPAAITAVRQAAAAEGADVHRLNADQVGDLAVAAARAAEAETLDPQQRAELAYWAGGAGPAGTGLSDAVIPDRPPQTTVPGRDFVRAGTLAVGSGHDRTAEYLMVFGSGDEPGNWLCAGEALSAAWLEATQLGLTVLPLSSVIEVPGTREAMRQILAGLGYPYLVLRLGAPDPDHAGPPHTPRLPADQIVDVQP